MINTYSHNSHLKHHRRPGHRLLHTVLKTANHPAVKACAIAASGAFALNLMQSGIETFFIKTGIEDILSPEGGGAIIGGLIKAAASMGDSFTTHHLYYYGAYMAAAGKALKFMSAHTRNVPQPS